MKYLSASKPVRVITLVKSMTRQAQSGTLEFERDGATKRLYFVEGQLYLCRSVSPLAQQVDERLSELKQTDSDTRDDVMTELIRLTANYLSSWKVSSYRFVEGFRVDVDELVGPLPTGPIVGDVDGAHKEGSKALMRAIGGPEAAVVANDLSTDQLKNSDLNREELDLLLRLVEPTSVRSLSSDSSESSSNTLRVAAKLWSLGLLRRATRSRSSSSKTLTSDLTKVSLDETCPSPRVRDVRTERSQEPSEKALVPEMKSLGVFGLGDWYRHLGLNCEPFSLTPDPAFLYLSDNHREALSGLRLSLVERRGLCIMTGEVGTGKTTLLYSLLSNLDGGMETAYVQNPALPFDQLLETVLVDLGVPYRSNRRIELLNSLNSFLISSAKKRKSVTLIIDEAQNLSDSTFEALRLLLNFETFDSKLLQIILVGQPELGTRLRSHNLRQIANRIAIRCQLEPLSQAESREYIQHRLEAGQGDIEIFSKGALGLVVKKARGIPRRINVICHNAMLNTFAQEESLVTRRHVAEAIRDIDK